MQATRSKSKTSGQYWVVSIFLLAVFMVLPAMGFLKFSEEFGSPVVLGYLAFVSVLTLIVYRSDKQRAPRDMWRIPESVLHLLELAGGWAAAFLSQRIFRHKIAKYSFQFTFWLIGILHNLIAFEYLNDWHYSGLLLQAINP